jgi:thiamine pyrophosphate-dependent acetolactate synthase large subunit-like protein
MQTRMKLGDFLVAYLEKIGVSHLFDGGFQMTGIEIVHAPRHGCNPIVLLVNNGGWGIFRPVAKQHDLLALPSMRYSELGVLWGGVGIRVGTVAELRRALTNAAQSSSFVIIEAMTGYRDLSPVSVKYIRASAKRALKSAQS